LLEDKYTEDEVNKIRAILNPAQEDFYDTYDRILFVTKNLENFIKVAPPDKFNLLTKINNACQIFNSFVLRIGGEITIEKTDFEPYIYAIPSYIQFVFEELLSNTITSYERLAKENKVLNINIYVSQDAEYWIVNYCDNVIGIPEEKKKAIFTSGESKFGSSGQGLFLCKLFLNQFDNDIIECGKYKTGVNFKLKFKKYHSLWN